MSEKSLWVGRTAPLGPSEGTEWAVTFLFDEPVNNLIFILGATGEVNNQDFVFNSNGGLYQFFLITVVIRPL
ncbi:hypothetical protein PFY10_19505 [Chryseobacterium daecheongense]|nr:hypothetical protein PFY10_19505 [Chryseobacterium daecheongense]